MNMLKWRQPHRAAAVRLMDPHVSRATAEEVRKPFYPVEPTQRRVSASVVFVSHSGFRSEHLDILFLYWEGDCSPE